MTGTGSGIALFERRALDAKPGFHVVVRGNGIIIIIIDWQRGAAPALIEDNICYDNGGRGIHVFNSAHLTMRRNTLVGSERTHGDKGCALRANTCDDVQFVDNSVVGCAGQPFSANWTPKSVTYTHNLFYNYLTVDPGTVDHDNAVGKDPLFVNASLVPGQADFRLRADSPAIGMGAPEQVARESAVAER